MKRSISNVLIGFLAGAASGAVLGILYAPDKGSKTRRKIKKNTHKLTLDVTESLGKQVDSMKRHVNDFVDDIKGKFETLESEIKEKVSEIQKDTAATVEEKARQARKSA